MYQALFPAVSNRESWAPPPVTVADEDTGEPFDLTGASITIELRCAGPSAGFYGYPTHSIWYDAFGGPPAPQLTAAIGSGITVVDVGAFQINLTPDQMRTLRPGTYDVGCLITRDGDARQLFLGKLPVLFGGVS